MTPVLYSNYNCPHSLKAAFFLSEKGIDFQRVEVNLSTREQKTEPYLAKNPNGTVPAYEDENGVIGDSLAIMQYIDANTDAPHFFPQDQDKLAEALVWVERADNDFWDVSHHLYWQLIEPPADGTDWDEVRRLKAKGIALLQELETLLTDQPYVLGEFSVVDVALLPWVYGYQRFDLPEAGQFPHVVAWRDALSSRQTFLDNHNKTGVLFEEFLASRKDTVPHFAKETP
ncbi:MAG: glutathione S-transferase family protein [Aggregatilineales bacterium]